MLPQKSTLNIFRDCLKLIPTMVKDEHKIVAVKNIVIQEFRRNSEKTNEKEIEKLRDNAIRGISNYMIFMIKSEYLKDPKKKEYFDEEAMEEEVIAHRHQGFSKQ